MSTRSGPSSRGRSTTDATHRRTRAKLERELAEREAKIARLLDQLEEGVAVDRLRARLTEHEARLAELRAELAAPVEVDVDALVRDALDDVAVVYRRQIAALVNEVERGAAAPEVFELVRGLVDEVVVHPAGNTATELVVRGDLAVFSACAHKTAPPRRGGVLVFARLCNCRWLRGLDTALTGRCVAQHSETGFP